jgi:hypothetical protein
MDESDFLTVAKPVMRPLTKKDLCEWISCSPRFIEKEVKAGRLKQTTLGRNRARFLPSDISAWLAYQRPIRKPALKKQVQPNPQSEKRSS